MLADERDDQDGEYQHNLQSCTYHVKGRGLTAEWVGKPMSTFLELNPTQCFLMRAAGARKQVKYSVFGQRHSAPLFTADCLNRLTLVLSM